MVDVTPRTPAEENDAPWDLIPWFVNGSLSEAESDLVKRHRDTNPTFAAEIDRETGLAAKVCMMDNFEEARGRSWDTLRSRIEAEEAARNPMPEQRAWWSNLLPKGGQGLALAGVACAALVMALVFAGPNTGTEGEEFRTLTGDPTGDGLAIKFQAAPDVDRAILEQILAKQGMTLTEGPSETGVFRAVIGQDMDAQNAADVLMQAPEILFAAPE